MFLNYYEVVSKDANAFNAKKVVLCAKGLYIIYDT